MIIAFQMVQDLIEKAIITQEEFHQVEEIAVTWVIQAYPQTEEMETYPQTEEMEAYPQTEEMEAYP